MKHTCLIFIVSLSIVYTTNTREEPQILSYTEDGDPLCLCPRHFDPLCGSDGKTYTNKCDFDCKRNNLEMKGLGTIQIASYGKCDDSVEMKNFLQEIHQELDNRDEIDKNTIENFQEKIPLEPVLY